MLTYSASNAIFWSVIVIFDCSLMTTLPLGTVATWISRNSSLIQVSTDLMYQTLFVGMHGSFSAPSYYFKYSLWARLILWSIGRECFCLKSFINILFSWSFVVFKMYIYFNCLLRNIQSTFVAHWDKNNEVNNKFLASKSVPIVPRGRIIIALQ